MKAVLEFDLTDLDQRQAHQRCLKSLELSLIVLEIKYGMQEERKSTGKKSAEKIFDKIDEIIERSKINLEELVS